MTLFKGKYEASDGHVPTEEEGFVAKGEPTCRHQLVCRLDERDSSPNVVRLYRHSPL